MSASKIKIDVETDDKDLLDEMPSKKEISSKAKKKPKGDSPKKQEKRKKPTALKSAKKRTTTRKSPKNEKKEKSDFLKKLEEQDKKLIEELTAKKIDGSTSHEESGSLLEDKKDDNSNSDDSKSNNNESSNAIGNDGPEKFEDGEQARSVGIYKKIAISFIVLTVGLLATVLYFNFARVTISLVPNQERINNNMIIDIYDSEKNQTASDGKIIGIVRKKSVEFEKEYKATGEDVIGEETVGDVTIFNYYTKNQPLVATTRLLSADGKLFRIKETVNVPANDSVEVEVYADEPGQEMAISPTKFTIPGLWAGLQDKIYGESKNKFEYRKKVKYFVKKEDIENGVLDLKQEVLKKTKSEVNDEYEEYSQIIFNIDEKTLSTEAGAEIDDEVDNFSISIHADVNIVAYNEKEAADLAEQRFISALPNSKELIEFNKENIIYNLNSFNSKDGSASVNATFEGKVSLKSESDVVEVEKILGLNKNQLDAYLMGKPEIAGYEVKFFPTFIKKVPNLVDRIKIEIKR